MNTLFALEDSQLGLWVSSTQWGYAIVLSLHAVGMATMVGCSMMLAFRVLGVGKGIPLAAMAPYWRIAQAGFVVNLLSGTALFFGSASELYFNWAFRTKLVLVFVGLVLMWRMVRICIKGPGEVAPSHRQLAAAAVATWCLALIIGRMIGYVS